MPTKVFVGRIAEGTTPEDIRVLFRKFGSVTECDVISNYGFVHMETEEEAKAAIAALDGYSVNGSHIHVELSTANTQGRKKRGFDGGNNFRGNGRGGSGGPRFDPYPPPRRDNYGGNGDMGRGGRGGMPPPERGMMDRGAPPPPPTAREEYASEQVKDLLELYFRDPYAFDQYARTYYYGERSERASAGALPPVNQPPPRGGGGGGYYDKRPEVGYSSSRREDDIRGGYGKGGYGGSSSGGGYDSSRMIRDDRGGNPPYGYK
jgi:RNA recognition motif-containing protein